MSSEPKKSIFAAIESFAAMLLAILPLFSYEALFTSGCWKRKPYFGPFTPALKCMNRAFSGPIIWRGEAGTNSIFFLLPIFASILAPITGPAISVKHGSSLPIDSSRYFARASLSKVRLRQLRASALISSMSVSPASEPIELFAADSILSAFSLSSTCSEIFSCVKFSLFPR
ncbi:Uncharacterised protein [uncultured archaeon]|nr:Uncharacterised protein [uncultured archaeon]